MNRTLAHCGCQCSAQRAPLCRPVIASLIQPGGKPKVVQRKLIFDPLQLQNRNAAKARASSAEPSDSFETTALPENFCIIESRDSVKNFANMQLDEIKQNIASRRNRIFLLMEEVRRLKIQQRLKVWISIWYQCMLLLLVIYHIRYSTLPPAICHHRCSPTLTLSI